VTIKYRELKRRYELGGAEQTVNHLSEALRERHLKAEDFSIRDLAEALVPDGREFVRLLDPRSAGTVAVLEAGDGVDTTAFLNVTGQVIYSKIMEAYQQEAFVASKLVDTIPTRMDGEKIPGIGRIAERVDEVASGMPYPHLGFGEDYIETPSTTKRGFIGPVTKEAIFFGRTHLVLSPAAEVGEILGLNKEKRIVDVVIGSTNNYKWKAILALIWRRYPIFFVIRSGLIKRLTRKKGRMGQGLMGTAKRKQTLSVYGRLYHPQDCFWITANIYLCWG
jgi:hypothetical protein